jgi:hypothetical protein
MSPQIVIPRLIERANGGWLAVSPRGCSLQIGVTADNEEDARAEFRTAFDQWRDMLNRDTGPATQRETENA